MWKWTDSENIKVVILDADSLKEEFFTYDYNKDIPGVKVVTVRQRKGENSIDSDKFCNININEIIIEIMKDTSIKKVHILLLVQIHYF